jgi:hypothetical protein
VPITSKREAVIKRRDKEVVKSLTLDLKAVKPQKAGVAASVWLLSAMLIVLPMAVLTGIRGDFAEWSQTSGFWVLFSFTLVAGYGLALSAFKLCIPGESISPLWLGVLSFLLVAWSGFVIVDYEFTIISGASSGLLCIGNLLALAFLPATLAFIMARRLSPTQLWKTGALVSLGVLVVAAFGVNLNCPSIQGVHYILWHGLPVIVMAVFLGFLGKSILRW